MTARSKTTLKTYFNFKDKPTEAQFADFIDNTESQRSINVRDYGVVGGGVVDDTAAFQSAIDAMADHDVLTMQKATYLITDDLVVDNNYVTIRCDGLAQIVRSGTGRIMTVTGNNVTLEGLSLTTAAGANNDHGLYVDGGYGLDLRRVLVTGAQKHGVYLTGNSNTVKTDHCLFDATDADAGYSAFYHGTGSHNVVHVMSRLNGAAVTAAQIIDGAQISFIGCDLSSTTGGANSIGLDVAGGWNLLINNCYMEGFGKYFIWLGLTV